MSFCVEKVPLLGGKTRDCMWEARPGADVCGIHARARVARVKRAERGRNYLMAAALIDTAHRHARGEIASMPKFDDESWGRMRAASRDLAENGRRLLALKDRG